VPTPTGREHEGEAFRAPERHVEQNRVVQANRDHDHDVRSFDQRREFDRLRERRHLDIAEDHAHAFHWNHYHPGTVVSVLPFGYVPTYVANQPFYYYGGSYYEPSGSEYVVVPPPVGATVPEVPPGAETVWTAGQVFYYIDGAFYVQEPNGFRVVPPPLGVTVSVLPSDASSVMINGRVYYQSRGVYYLPAMQDGVTVYVTTQP